MFIDRLNAVQLRLEHKMSEVGQDLHTALDLIEERLGITTTIVERLPSPHLRRMAQRHNVGARLALIEQVMARTSAPTTLIIRSPYFWLGVEAEAARHCICGDCDGYDHTVLYGECI